MYIGVQWNLRIKDTLGARGFCPLLGGCPLVGGLNTLYSECPLHGGCPHVGGCYREAPLYMYAANLLFFLHAQSMGTYTKVLQHGLNLSTAHQVVIELIKPKHPV